jgi:hypothetical protein
MSCPTVSQPLGKPARGFVRLGTGKRRGSANDPNQSFTSTGGFGTSRPPATSHDRSRMALLAPRHKTWSTLAEQGRSRRVRGPETRQDWGPRRCKQKLELCNIWRRAQGTAERNEERTAPASNRHLHHRRREWRRRLCSASISVCGGLFRATRKKIGTKPASGW